MKVNNANLGDIEMRTLTKDSVTAIARMVHELKLGGWQGEMILAYPGVCYATLFRWKKINPTRKKVIQ